MSIDTRDNWAVSQTAGTHVLVLSEQQQDVAALLTDAGRMVLVVPPNGESHRRIESAIRTWPASELARVAIVTLDSVLRGTHRTEGKTQQSPPAFDTLFEGEAGFDCVVLTGTLASVPQPESVVRAIAGFATSGSRLVVSVPFIVAPSSRGGGVGLAAFVEWLRDCCTPEALSIEEGVIRFVGRIDASNAKAWQAYSAEVLLRMSEEASFDCLARMRNQIDEVRRTTERLRWGAEFQVGSLMVAAARNPAKLPRLPFQLIRFFLSRRKLRHGIGTPKSTNHAARAIPTYLLPEARPPRSPKVAAILDKFTRDCLRYDVNLVPITRKRWREELERERPDMLLVESAWHGNDGEWSYCIAQQGTNGQGPLGELVEYCRTHKIPTVFWNKEDPPSFDDFIQAARRFDWVFTTDANCIPRYRDACGHDRVAVMPFAAQPKIHNPHREFGWPLRDVAFAGSWMGQKYPERTANMVLLLDPALQFGLHIYDRNLAVGDERQRFPDRYSSAVQGSLPYDQMLAAYRCYRVMLNTNSVDDSPTMFSRRVLESLACGTPVLSTPSEGMERMLPGYVHVTHSVGETEQHLQSLLGDESRRHRLGHLGYRFVHTHHTYQHRLADMYERVGLPAPPMADSPTVSVIIATHRPQLAERCLETFSRQAYPNKELVLALNNADFDVDSIRSMGARLPNVRVLHVDGKTTLGEVLNSAILATSGAFIAKMDDDDHYGTMYLHDAVLAARFSGAEVIGKAHYFTHIEDTDELARRAIGPEHDFTSVVSGATLVIRRELFRSVPFRAMPKGTDTAFIRDAAAEGCRVYSADRYNFVLVRRRNAAGHTWSIPDGEFRRMCQDAKPGLDLSRVMI